MPQPARSCPPFGERLKLTDDQKKQVETLQKDVDEKLAKILTEDQQKHSKDVEEATVAAGFGGAGGKGGGKGVARAATRETIHRPLKEE